VKAADLIHEVTRHGCNITVQNDTLKLTAPRPLPDALMNELRRHKPDVIAELLQSARVRLTVIECKHCGARYWHHLGHLTDGGKVAGGPCCFGHAVLTVAKYPTEEQARKVYPWPEETGEPDHGPCCKCGTFTTACVTYPDGRLEWICKGCYSEGIEPLPDTEKATDGDLRRSDHG